MQTENVAEQMTLLDVDSSFGRMCREHFLQEKTKTETPSKEKISAVSSKKSPKSSRRMFGFLDLRTDGPIADASSWTAEALPGDYTMHSISELPNGEKDCVSWLTSTDLLHQGFCLTLNLSEHPRVANPSLLSEVLEEDADSRYNLSSKACKGILNRANRRGKKLPEVLEKALKTQVGDEELH